MEHEEVGCDRKKELRIIFEEGFVFLAPVITQPIITRADNFSKRAPRSRKNCISCAVVFWCEWDS